MTSYKNEQEFFEKIIKKGYNKKIYPKDVVKKINGATIGSIVRASNNYILDGKIEKKIEVICNCCCNVIGTFNLLKEIPEKIECSDCGDKNEIDESKIQFYFIVKKASKK